MNPSEAWALLTIRSKHFPRQPAGHGATTTYDVAALLAGLDRDPFMMGMAAECGDENALKQIELVLWVRAKTISDSENWDPPRGEFTVRRMVAVALFEAIDDRRCVGCNGKGYVTFTIHEHPALMFAPTFEQVSPLAGRVRCSVCQGSGQVRLSGRKKAALAGINKDVWTRTWQRRYEPIFSIARNWREAARQYLAARIREIDDGNVDKPPSAADFSGAGARAKNVIPIKDSCSSVKNRDTRRPRRTAPERNLALAEDPADVNFAALGRTTLSLNR